MKKLFILILVIASISVKAEYNVNQWYFGYNAGIDFNSGTPQLLFNGEMRQWEGCATICDENGDLLLYSDGTYLFNRFHELVENGSNLRGNNSSTQSSIFVPDPSDNSRMYLFTTGAMEYPGNDLYYNLIDYNSANGKGSLITKNQLLLTNSSEKVTAVDIPFEDAYWVISHGWENSEFYIYKVDENGVNLHSTHPTNMYDVVDRNVDLNRGAGYLKFSMNAGKLCAAAEGKGFYLYDFDVFTGEISNEKEFLQRETKYAYGVEFSRSGKFLYISTIEPVRQGNTVVNRSDLFQFELDANNIFNSAVLLRSHNQNGAAIQMAPNDKIYLAKGTEYLDVINIPEGKGTACNYQYDDLFLGTGRRAHFGFPNFIQNFNEPPLELSVNDPVCIGSTIYLNADYFYKADFEWKGPNGFISDLKNPVINNADINNEGYYYCKMTVNDEFVLHDTVFVNIISTDVSLDISTINKDTVCIYNEITQRFSIKNTGNDDIVINEILSESSLYDLHEYNNFIPVDKELNIELSHFASETGNINDKIFVVYSGLCKTDTLEIELNNYVEKGQLTINIPNLTADPGERICFDITGSTICDIDESQDLSFNLVFDPSIFYITDVNNGIILDSIRNLDGKSYVKIMIDDVSKLKIDGVICTICGETMLGPNKNSLIEIDSLSIDENYDVNASNGSITLTNVCVNDLRLIEIYDLTQLVIEQDINETKIIVKGEENGQHTLEIFNSELTRVYIESWMSDTKFEKEFLIEDLSSGIYFVIVKTPAGFEIKDKFVLVR